MIKEPKQSEFSEQESRIQYLPAKGSKCEWTFTTDHQILVCGLHEIKFGVLAINLMTRFHDLSRILFLNVMFGQVLLVESLLCMYLHTSEVQYISFFNQQTWDVYWYSILHL